MGFGGTGGGSSSIAGSTDVALSTLTDNDILTYSAGNTKWMNGSLIGKAATATGGGNETVQFLNSQTGAVTLDTANGNVFSAGLSGNVTFTFTNTALNKAGSFGLYIYAASGKTITWPTGIKWLGGTAPTLAGSGANPDVLVFETLNGSTWHGTYVGNFS